MCIRDRSSTDLAKSVELSPNPALSEPTIVIAPTQKSRHALTNPFAISVSDSLPDSLADNLAPIRCSPPSMFNAVPIAAPSSMDIVSSSTLDPCSAPDMPIYNTQRPMTFIIISENFLDVYKRQGSGHSIRYQTRKCSLCMMI